jgi:predicted nucleotidyltransferase
MRMAETLAAQLDPARFGVKGLYVFGSTKSASAGPESDINLIVHFQGAKAKRRDLELWLEGWSRSLAEMNFERTGERCGGLLDVHFITDDDIAHRTSYAVRIGAATDAAKPLVLGRRPA